MPFKYICNYTFVMITCNMNFKCIILNNGLQFIFNLIIIKHFICALVCYSTKETY